MSITVASLHIYPIKSIGGFSVTQATLTDRGFEHDRRWMLVDERGRFLSQRELPTMACLHTTPGSTGMVVTDSLLTGDGVLKLSFGKKKHVLVRPA